MPPRTFPIQVPEWIDDLNPSDLPTIFGLGSAQRGATYARQGKVITLSVSKDASTISGRVAGSRSLYSTSVQARPIRGPGLRPQLQLFSACSCPIGGGCKHVVAVILTAREQSSNGPRSAPLAHPSAPPPWQRLLDRAVAPVGTSPAGHANARALALLVHLIPDAGGTAFARLQLRPLVPGKNGWVRTGISWNDLRYNNAWQPNVETHHEALSAILRASQTGYISNTGAWIEYADLGRGGWRLLSEAAQAGVELLADQDGIPVHLPASPAHARVDAIRDAQGSVRLHPSLPIEGASGRTMMLAARTHTIAMREPERLVLARLERPLTEGLSELIALPEDLVIPAQDVTAFLTSYYPALRQVATVQSPDGSVDLPTISGPRLALRIAFEAGHVARLAWFFRYAVGEDSLDVPLLRGPRDPLGQARDADAEEALLASLDVLDAAPGLRIPLPGKTRLGVVLEPVLQGWATVQFVRDVLPTLRARDDLDLEITGVELDYAEATEPPVVSIGATDALPGRATGASAGEAADTGAALDWFDLSIDVTVAGQDVPLATLLGALTLGEERLLLDNGTWFDIAVPELLALRRIVDEARSLHDREPNRLRINRFQAGLWEELVSLGVVTRQSARWRESVGALLDLRELPSPPVPAGVLAELRPYQVDGYHWLSVLWQLRLGGILADDMGLGKTLQTLAFLEQARIDGELSPDAPALVVAPTSVVAAWQREASRFTPGLRVAAVTQTAARSGAAFSELLDGAHVVVTSYALLRIDTDHYTGVPWSVVVLDEAQAVKNHQSKTYQAARRLPARTKIAITGTPLENSLMDLWSLLSIVAPGLFPSPQRFGELYRKPIESGQSPDLLATLRRRIRPLMMRRTKEAVATDLPPKVEQVLTVPLNSQQRRIYDTHLQRERQRLLGLLDDVNRNRIAILAGLTRLRQLALDVHLVEPDAGASIKSSKVEALLEQLVEVAAEGHRCLVFSQFTGFLAIVRERLTAAGLDHVYLDGRTRDRPRRIAQFTDGDAPVFLISLKAGGSGLTLTEADYVFVLDPWWNPAVEAQAVDRAHRIGQDKPVFVYRLVAEDTIEEKVVALQERKRDLFAKVVDEGDLMNAPLTADDLRSLLD